MCSKIRIEARCSILIEISNEGIQNALLKTGYCVVVMTDIEKDSPVPQTYTCIFSINSIITLIL